jgi:hypothetical protein
MPVKRAMLIRPADLVPNFEGFIPTTPFFVCAALA